MEIEKWLRKNDHDTTTPDLRAYLAQWKLKQEQDSFLLNKPRRLQYFRHLLRLPWTYGEIMTRRHRAHSYARACAALVLGYRHLHLADDAWQEFKQRTAFRGAKRRGIAA